MTEAERDRELVERIGNLYRPAPMSAERAARFEERLRGRLDGWRLPQLLPGLATGAAALAIVWMVGDASSPEPQELTIAAWTNEVVEAGATVDGENGSDLPEEYELLGEIVFGG